MVFWLSEGNLYDELSVAGPRIHADASMVPVDDNALNDFEPEPGTLACCFGREERLEEVLANLGRNAGPVIFDNNDSLVSVAARRNRENARIAHGVKRVRNQIGPGLIQFAGVGADFVKRAIV